MVECEAIHRPRSLPCHGDAGDTRTTWTDGMDGAIQPGTAEARRTHGTMRETSAARGMSREDHLDHREANHRAIRPITIPAGLVTPIAQTLPTSRTSTHHGKAKACAIPFHLRLNRPDRLPNGSGAASKAPIPA